SRSCAPRVSSMPRRRPLIGILAFRRESARDCPTRGCPPLRGTKQQIKAERAVVPKPDAKIPRARDGVRAEEQRSRVLCARRWQPVGPISDVTHLGGRSREDAGGEDLRERPHAG